MGPFISIPRFTHHTQGNSVLFDEIFELFYTTKRFSGSSGLGLHICYNLTVKKLEGAIQFLPSDQGAKFIITMKKSALD